MFQNLIDIFAAPGNVFKRLKEKPTVLLPLLLVIAFVASTQVGYVLLTDRGYMIDQMVEQALAGNPNVTEEQLRDNLGQLNTAILIVPGLIAVPLILGIIFSLYAGYLHFMAKFGQQEFSYKHWFSLVAWTSMPTILSSIAAWAVLLSSTTGQVPQTELQVLSIASILALDTDSSLLRTLDVGQLWSMALLVLGYRHFTGAGPAKSIVVALAPSILIFGIWALITLL